MTDFAQIVGFVSEGYKTFWGKNNFKKHIFSGLFKVKIILLID